MDARIASYVRRQTVPTPVPLVPEIALRLAAEPHGIFQSTEEFERDGDRLLPFWAFAWPGGQVAARHLLDHPGLVRGRRVVDIGAGSGIAAIAAALSGAADVLAVDIDPLAVAAVALNAGLNGVAVRTTMDDVLGTVPDADLVLIGDLVYEPALATRVTSFLEAAARCGLSVLLADRTTARRPPLAFDLLVEHDAPVAPLLAEAHFERARLWRLRTAAPAARRSPA